MRIIAGALRGRRLSAPAGQSTRPTSDRAREALFSMLASRLGSLEGLRVADLYAGSGALGFEALSRGAVTCCFVDHDHAVQRAIRANAETLGVGDRIEMIAASAASLPKREPFDLVFADPPYAPGSGSAVVRSVESAGWLAAAGWMAVESEQSDPVEPGSLRIEADRRIGRARLTLLFRP